MRRILVLALALFCSISLFGQPGDPGGDPDAVPISGIEILLGIGGAFGAKKLFRKKKNI